MKRKQTQTRRWGRRGRERKKVLEVGVDAGWPLSSSLQQALHQASGLLYRVELLITQGEEERWCFLFEGVSSFCLPRTQLGRHRLRRQNKRHLEPPGLTSAQKRPGLWNASPPSVTPWLPGWHSDPKSRLTWPVAHRYQEFSCADSLVWGYPFGPNSPARFFPAYFPKGPIVDMHPLPRGEQFWSSRR